MAEESQAHKTAETSKHETAPQEAPAPRYSAPAGATRGTVTKEFEPDLTPTVYWLGGAGAVLGGVLGAFAIGFPAAIGAVVIGGLLGGILGLFFK